MVVAASMKKMVMKIKLSIIEDKCAMPAFMSFGQVEAYTNLCVACESKGVLIKPLIFGTKKRTLPLNTLPHIMVVVGRFQGVAFPLTFMVSS